MSTTPDDPRIVYMPEDQILAASGHVDAMRNRWFSVHPERGLMFWQTERRRMGKLTGASPQCNSDEATARKLAQQLYPWAETRFYPLVLAPIDVSDWRD